MLQQEFYTKLEKARQKQDELYHYGILGQKWGVRRFQYMDGSYTQAGRERYGIGPARESNNEKIEGPVLQIALVATGGLVPAIGVAAVGDAIHNAKISKDIKNWEANRQLEKTDKATGLKLKSNPDATIQEDMKMINREYGYGLFMKGVMGIESRKTLGRTENCMLCTTALDLKRRGYDVKAGSSNEGYYAKDVKNWYKEKKDATMGRFNAIIEKLQKEPEGSYGNLMVYWKEGGGHSMFYRIEDNKVVLYDAQSNKKYNLNRIARHANMTIPGHCFLRTDNLTPDYEYLKKNNLIG